MKPNVILYENSKGSGYGKKSLSQIYRVERAVRRLPTLTQPEGGDGSHILGALGQIRIGAVRRNEGGVQKVRDCAERYVM